MAPSGYRPTSPRLAYWLAKWNRPSRIPTATQRSTPSSAARASVFGWFVVPRFNPWPSWPFVGASEIGAGGGASGSTRSCAGLARPDMQAHWNLACDAQGPRQMDFGMPREGCPIYRLATEGHGEQQPAS